MGPLPAPLPPERQTLRDTARAAVVWARTTRVNIRIVYYQHVLSSLSLLPNVSPATRKAPVLSFATVIYLYTLPPPPCPRRQTAIACRDSVTPGSLPRRRGNIRRAGEKVLHGRGSGLGYVPWRSVRGAGLGVSLRRSGFRTLRDGMSFDARLALPLEAGWRSNQGRETRREQDWESKKRQLTRNLRG